MRRLAAIFALLSALVPGERCLAVETPPNFARDGRPFLEKHCVACHSADGSTDQELVRSYEGGKSPKEGFDLWNGHLTGKGWKPTGETKDDDVYHQETYENEGAKIALQCSKRKPDKGWCTLSFTPKG